MTAVVIGTGAMGPEIAVALAAAGHRVTIAGRAPDRAADAAARAAGLGGDPAAITAAGIDADALAGADLVVETIAEDLEAKRDLLRRVEPWLRPDAIVASNTSSLRIADLADAVARPGRLAGLHFLKPAHLTSVVEVVAGPATDDATVAALRDVAGRMGKAPLVSADVPGFIWNRIQFAVLRECLHMLETGVADAASIDAAMSDGLAPRWMAAGPLATADLGGLRTFATISRGLFPHLADGHDAPAVLEDAAASGTPLAPWTAGAGDAVAQLRADALAAGREFAARRRALGA
ncbi:MAG: 3-hydroxyacyl-CoA dehydrogenase family protein [Thermoleophilia bacterium]